MNTQVTPIAAAPGIAQAAHDRALAMMSQGSSFRERREPTPEEREAVRILVCATARVLEV